MKIPARKHKGVKDPVKQAAARFAGIKDKINNPPTELDNQAVPKKVLELKNAMDRLKTKRLKKEKTKKQKTGKLIDTSLMEAKPFKQPGMKRREKPVPVFKQLPGETENSFVHRISLKCQEVIHESQFEDKFNVEVNRNEETGNIESVAKLSKQEAKFLRDLKPEIKNKKGKPKKSEEKRKERLQKLKDKKQAKKIGKVDEFAKYRDEVKFGETVHAPPKLTTLPRRAPGISMPGKRDLLLKGLLPQGKRAAPSVSVFDRKLKSDVGKVGKKKKNEKSPAEKRRLEAQRVAAVEAYRTMKARNQSKNSA